MSAAKDTKQFQYEIQEYQEDCIDNIVSIFDSLHQKEDFEGLGKLDQR